MSGESRVFFKKKYDGFEAIYDLEQDISEAFDKRLNLEHAHNIPSGEFQGTVTVMLTYTEEQA